VVIRIQIWANRRPHILQDEYHSEVYQYVTVDRRLALLTDCYVCIQICCVLCADFFNEECKEDAEKDCDEFLLDVPLSEQFNSTAFERFCK